MRDFVSGAYRVNYHDDAYVIIQGHSLSAASLAGVLANDEASSPLLSSQQYRQHLDG